MFITHTIGQILRNLLNYKVCLKCYKLILSSYESCCHCHSKDLSNSEEKLNQFILFKEYELKDEHGYSEQQFQAIHLPVGKT